MKQLGLMKDFRIVSVEEALAMSLRILGHGTRQIMVSDRFQHSTGTVHYWFKKVLRALKAFELTIVKHVNRGVNCIGAIDGTHVVSWAPASKQKTFRDYYYVVDSGYPNLKGFLAPYRGERYHCSDWQGREAVKGKHELFNFMHSSVRNVIERDFGVL
ncbi:hypothetical protein Tco_0020805 [Tanacetum coccineum]